MLLSNKQGFRAGCPLLSVVVVHCLDLSVEVLMCPDLSHFVALCQHLSQCPKKQGVLFGCGSGIVRPWFEVLFLGWGFGRTMPKAIWLCGSKSWDEASLKGMSDLKVQTTALTLAIKHLYLIDSKLTTTFSTIEHISLLV